MENSQNNENDELKLGNEKFIKSSLAKDGLLLFFLHKTTIFPL